MELALSIAGWTVFSLGILVGLALTAVGLFGNWIILLTVGAAWAVTGFERFSLWGLGIMLVLAAIGEIVEFAASAIGTSRFGGSKGGAVAAVVGCLVGAVAGSPLFPIIGTLIGACLGAFVGAVLYEYIKMEREVDEAVRAGIGAAIGRVGGVLGKLTAGVCMLAVAVVTF